MNNPIESIIHNDPYLRVARLQDIVVQIISKNTDATLHGGTAIWRCCDGGRFSEDIDLYARKRADVRKLVNKIALSDLRITFNRERRGTMYYDISNDDADISLQIKVANKKGILIFYEKVDGTKTQIYSLSPEALVNEKIEAYTNRRLIRDIYDIVILTKSIPDKGKSVKQIRAFVSSLEKPKDERVLKVLVYNGPVPSFADMIEYLQRWCAT